MDAIGEASFFPIVERLQLSAAHGADDDLILLSGRSLRAVLQPKGVIEALHDAYARLATNRADQGKSLAFVVDGGSAHVKAGLLPGSRSILAAKVNVNLPDNWKRRGLPTFKAPCYSSTPSWGARWQ
jgi:hypothetical protein